MCHAGKLLTIIKMFSPYTNGWKEIECFGYCTYLYIKLNVIVDGAFPMGYCTFCLILLYNILNFFHFIGIIHLPIHSVEHIEPITISVEYREPKNWINK